MTTEEEDQIIATLSDYLDGTLAADQKTHVETKLATDDEWKRLHTEMREVREGKDQISGILKARQLPAPETFTNDVTKTIHKRSAGRFFGRRTFGDRVPFEALLVLAVLGLAVIGYLLWSSQTGSLKIDKKVDAPPKIEPLVPKP